VSGLSLVGSREVPISTRVAQVTTWLIFLLTATAASAAFFNPPTRSPAPARTTSARVRWHLTLRARTLLCPAVAAARRGTRPATDDDDMPPNFSCCVCVCVNTR
jgi:hypothetical protein